MKQVFNPAVVLIFASALSFGRCSIINRDNKNSVSPIHHKGYYKKHLYKKHLSVGKFRINWFEKQGVKQTRR